MICCKQARLFTSTVVLFQNEMKKAAKINTFKVSDFAAQVKTVGGSEANRCKHPARLDTYGCGCAHDCAYCYARSLLEFRGLWNPRYPKVTDYDKMKRIIAKTKTGSVLRLGGMTDCFQPVEERSRATWKAIKWLNQKGIHYLIVTKSDLVASPLYTDLMDKDLAHIQVSITSTDPAKSRAIENAPLPERRIAAAERLQELGFDTAVRLSPFIPGMYDFDVINRIQCDKVLVEFLRVNAWIRKWLGGDFPEHTHTEGGYDHLPLEWKKYYLSKITGFKQISVCEDVATHYAYWKNNVNHNPDDCCNLTLKK